MPTADRRLTALSRRVRRPRDRRGAIPPAVTSPGTAGSLASTGISVGRSTAFAAALIAGGMALVAAASRRKPRYRPDHWPRHRRPAG